MTIQLSQYHISNGRIYQNEGLSEQVQELAWEAMPFVSCMIRENQELRNRIERGHYDYETAQMGELMADTALCFSAVVFDTVTDPWFWMTMHLSSYPSFYHSSPSGYGSCGSSPDVSCGSCDGDGCLAIILVIAISILVACVAVGIGFTVKHGADAEKARKKLNEIKSFQRQAHNLRQENERIYTIYQKICSLQRKEWESQSLKTIFTATITLGLSFLTTSAIIALYGIFMSMPVSPSATYFAIAGGLAVFGGLGAHAIRSGTLQRSKNKKAEKLISLLIDLHQLAPHPYRILAETRQNQAILRIGTVCFIKNGDRFTKEEADNTPEHYYSDYANIIIN